MNSEPERGQFKAARNTFTGDTGWGTSRVYKNASVVMNWDWVGKASGWAKEIIYSVLNLEISNHIRVSYTPAYIKPKFIHRSPFYTSIGQ